MPRLHRLLLSTHSSNAAPAPEAVAVESDFVVILAALLCALICVVGLIAVARCAWLRRSPSADAPPPPAANKGLKKKILQSLPKYKYRPGGGAGDKFACSECAICLAEFAEGEEMRVLPQCGHAFHVSCIDTWLGSHSSCPSCRRVLVAARCKSCGRFPEGDAAADLKVGGGEAAHCSNNGFLPCLES